MANQKLVNLHIVGAQKSGTSALAHFLHQHRDIYVVDGKEAHVFDSPKFLSSANKMQHAKEKYVAYLSEYDNEEYICDATPITWTDLRFLKHCYAYNKSAKFIVILRDPVARAFSQFKMSTSREQEDQSFIYAVLHEKQRLLKHTNNLAFTSPWRHQSYLTRSLYRHQLKQLFKTIPGTQVLVLFQEELKNNHQTTLDKVFSFLNLDKTTIHKQLVFESERYSDNIYDKLGKLYAHMYFYLKGENRKSWDKIIRAAQESADAQN